MIEIVSATRHSKTEFWKSSALGQSLKRLEADTRLSSFIAFENRRGLPEVYNARIDSAKSPEILVFMHDDVWIDDFYFAERILEGLAPFDLIGVAGNRRRVENQASWAVIDDDFTWDSKEHLSGRVAYGNYPFGQVWIYGAAPAPCELLDGLFLAARKSTLLQHDLRFDPQFAFHFYDLDMCRQARRREVRLGTWPICLTHQSGGNFDSPEWRAALQGYRAKWGA